MTSTAHVRVSSSRCEEYLGKIVDKLDHPWSQHTSAHGQSNGMDNPPDHPELGPVEPRDLKKSPDPILDSNTTDSRLAGIKSTYQADNETQLKRDFVLIALNCALSGPIYRAVVIHLHGHDMPVGTLTSQATTQIRPPDMVNTIVLLCFFAYQFWMAVIAFPLISKFPKGTFVYRGQKFVMPLFE